MDKYSGKVSFYDKNVDFDLENGRLTLFLPGDISQKIMYKDLGNGIRTIEKQPLNVNRLSCLTNDGFKNIVCFFDEINYVPSSKTMFHDSSVIIIHLNFYIVFDKTKSTDNYSMTFYSKNIHKLTNIIPEFEYDDTDEKISINFNFPSISLETQFVCESYEITMSPTYIYKIIGTSINFTPGLSMHFNKKIETDDIEKFYFSFLKFVHYCCMRTNIKPDVFVLCNGEYRGEIHSTIDLIDNDDIEDIYSVNNDSFSWNILYKKAGDLFNLIYTNSIHILNNQEKKNTRLAVSYESVTKDAAAFENEFEFLFPDGVPYSEERRKTEEEIANELNTLMNNSSGKKKKIYKNLIRFIHIESLGDKIEYALNMYSLGFEKVRKKLEIPFSNSEIAEFCRLIRNDVDHGNRIENISNDTVLSYIMLRCLIYTMQLSRANFCLEDINTLTNLLYSIKGLPV